ncbi:MAG: 50S ribosomal protein L6 [Candidatus Paceibacterota bacterium]
MSRIGKKPVAIPQGTEVKLQDGSLTVKGPKGEITRSFKPSIEIKVENGEVTFQPTEESKEAQALWGTYASHVSNMIKGVNEPYEKKLEVNGVGYRVGIQGNKLVLNVGYSHPVEIEIPDELDVSVEKNEITVQGIDKEKVGQFSANVRSVRKPEPYKGKGVKYADEIIRRKEGKKTV